MRKRTASAAIRVLLDVPSLAVEIKEAVMITTYRLSCLEERMSSFIHRKLRRVCPAVLWKATPDRIKTHLVLDAPNRRPRTVSEPTIAANCRRMTG